MGGKEKGNNCHSQIQQPGSPKTMKHIYQLIKNKKTLAVAVAVVVKREEVNLGRPSGEALDLGKDKM